jgi:RAQPRD family integrative conjugative element protein
MTRRELLILVCSIVTTFGITHELQALGQEEASRIYLNQSLYHLRQAQRYADQSGQTVPLAGFDYAVYQRDLDTVADGVETFLHPRPGDPIRVVPVEIDGQYLSEALLRHGKALEETADVVPRASTGRFRSDAPSEAPQ